MKPPSAITLVINTFNQPDYLARVLAAVTGQSSPPDEVLLADDGSEPPTRELFLSWSAEQKFHAAHVWQAHEGFRRASILNQSIAAARGDYLVFLDGDTVPHPDFIADHRAAARPEFFVQGHRALVEQAAAAWFGKNNFSADRRRAVLQNQISGLKNSFRWPFVVCKIKSHLRGIRGCNLAIWREDLVRVNGYNEDFTGWGREDSELAVRLMNTGVQRLDLRGRALCFHLWHPPASRANLGTNDELLEKTRREKITRCEHGLAQHR
ncbi:MAG: glycosyltransferase family 2 protein [Verrucomicrobiales bacterium]|nr:glycosyltransferase family 2 protein [Verrucomicrobiales bacterium]